MNVSLQSSLVWSILIFMFEEFTTSPIRIEDARLYIYVWHTLHILVWFGEAYLHSSRSPTNIVISPIHLLRVNLTQSLLDRPPVLFTAWRHRGFFRDFEAKANCRARFCRRLAPAVF